MFSHRSLRYLLLLLLLCLLPPFVPIVSAQSDGTVVVRVQPETIRLGVNAETDIALEVVDVEELYGVDLSLAYDPAYLEVVDLDPGLEGVQVALGTFLEPGFTIINRVDQEAGQIRFAMTQLNPSPPQNGTGAVVVVRLRSRQVQGRTALTLSRAELARPNGTKIETILQSGEVEIVAATANAPTPTPIPTRASNTPLPTATMTPSRVPVTATPVPPTATQPPAATATARPTTSASTATPIAPATATTAATATSGPELTPTPTATPTLESSPTAAIASADTLTPTSVTSPPQTPTTTLTASPEVIGAAETPVPPQASPTAGIRAMPIPSPSASQSNGGTGSRTFLMLGIGFLGLAAVVTAVLYFLWRRGA